MRLLALDLASNVGVAFGVPGATPKAWSFRLPKTGDDVGAYLDIFSKWLVDTLSQHSTTHLCFEAPLIRGDHTALATARKLISLAGLTEMHAHRRGIDCSEAYGSEVTKFFTGRARYDGANANQRRAAKKAAVMAKCRALGWDFADDDGADALATWCFVENLLCPGVREISPLFERGAK